MENESTIDDKIACIEEKLEVPMVFLPAEEVQQNAQIVLADLLARADEEGIDEVSVLTRRISQTTVGEDGETKEELYNIQYSLHAPGEVEHLYMYDSILTTYYLGSRKHLAPTIDFFIGSQEDAEYLASLPPEDVDSMIQKSMESEEPENAQFIGNTRDAYFKIREREQRNQEDLENVE